MLAKYKGDKMFFQYLISVISGSAFTFLIVGFFGRKFINHQLSKSLAKYQMELDARIEILKNNLSIFAHEQNVGISRIDSQRADAIKEIYSSLVNWEFKIKMINNPLMEKYEQNKHQDYMLDFYKKSLKGLSDDMNTMVYAIVNNAIYFKKDVFEKLEKLFLKVAIYSSNVGSIINKNLGGEGNGNIENVLSEITQLKNDIEPSINLLQNELIEEFRVLLKACYRDRNAHH
ncbi:MAG: hypothetical protein JXI43_02240 [Tissierellales bacterium]|nr:hypothetical protein [Tissierellales bacterium]